MLNQFIAMGNLTEDPVLRTTNSGVNVCSFRIAVSRDVADKNGDKGADFFNCVAWRSTGEFVSKYFQKGKPILIKGSLRNREWEGKDGVKHRTIEVAVDSVYFAGGKRNDASAEPVLTDIDDSDGKLPWEDGDDDLPL